MDILIPRIVRTYSRDSEEAKAKCLETAGWAKRKFDIFCHLDTGTVLDCSPGYTVEVDLDIYTSTDILKPVLGDPLPPCVWSYLWANSAIQPDDNDIKPCPVCTMFQPNNGRYTMFYYDGTASCIGPTLVNFSTSVGDIDEPGDAHRFCIETYHQLQRTLHRFPFVRIEDTSPHPAHVSLAKETESVEMGINTQREGERSEMDLDIQIVYELACDEEEAFQKCSQTPGWVLRGVTSFRHIETNTIVCLDDMVRIRRSIYTSVDILKPFLGDHLPPPGRPRLVVSAPVDEFFRELFRFCPICVRSNSGLFYWGDIHIACRGHRIIWFTMPAPDLSEPEDIHKFCIQKHEEIQRIACRKPFVRLGDKSPHPAHVPLAEFFKWE